LNLNKILSFSIGPVIAAILSLITLPFVAWFFSIEDVGRLTMLQVVLGLAVSFFSLAMHQSYVREYHEENDKQALFKLSVIPGLILLFISTIIILVIALHKSINICLLKKMLNFSLPLVAGGLAYWGLTTMDRFFLRGLSGFDELGVYALSVAIAGSVSVISSIFSNLWHPILYKWVKIGVDTNKVQCVIDNMVIAFAFIWSLFGTLSFILVWFLPTEYKATEYLIVACVAMPLFYMLAQTTGVGIGINRRSKYAMLASIIAFLVNGLLNYLLIPNYGAAGAALASLLAFFIFFVVRTESSARLWFSFSRVKMYILTIAYVMATSVMVLSKAMIGYFYIVWLTLFLLTCLFYFSRINENTIFLKNYIRRNI